MPKHKLRHYNGELNPEQTASGMNAASRNAHRLLSDAKFMFDGGRYATAAALAILAIEESGKVSILRGLSMAPDKESRRRLWNDYRSHRSKNAAWILPDLAAKGARTLDALQVATDKDAGHTFVLDNLKQLSLYTDCLGNRHWAEPEEVVDRSLAQMLVTLADTLGKL